MYSKLIFMVGLSMTISIVNAEEEMVQCKKDPNTGIVSCDDGTLAKMKSDSESKEKEDKNKIHVKAAEKGREYIPSRKGVTTAKRGSAGTNQEEEEE